MSARSPSLLSTDPVERLDAVRKLVRRLAAASDIDDGRLGRALGYAQPRFSKVMTTGERSGLRLSDLILLCDLLGDEILEHFATERGYRLVRDVEAAGPTGLDALAASCAALEELAGVVTRLADMRGRAALPSDGASVGEALGRIRRQLVRVELEASARASDTTRGGR